MTTATRLALGGLAIVVVGLIGVSLFGQNVGNPPPTPIPSPTMAAAISLPAFGDLDAGTYRIRNPGWTALPFTVTVPDGWTTTEGWLTKGDTEDPTGRTVFLNSWIVSHVFSDGCMRGSDEDLLVETPTAEDIVATLAEQGGHETTGPTATSLGAVRLTSSCSPSPRHPTPLHATVTAFACGLARVLTSRVASSRSLA